jgi:hypothetical protein
MWQVGKLNMKIPSFDALQKHSEDDGVGRSYAGRMNPNPKLYKYRWWVFWRESACDGPQFLDEKHSLCTADAMALIDTLTRNGECHWIYNKRMPRDQPGVTSFDRSSPKWRNVQFAPTFHCDADSEWNGFR